MTKAKDERAIYFFIRLIIILIFILSSPNLSQAQENSSPGFPTGDYSELIPAGKVTVTQIISPDTLGISDGRILTLTGLDFPDLYNGPESGPLAQMAQRVLSDMLIGQDIRLYQTKNKELGRLNRMNHHLAQIERASDGAWIQGTLISLGLARVRTTLANRDMAPQMLIQEMDARAAKRGLWNTPQYDILTPENITEDKLNQFQIIEGTVKTVATNKNRIYINFGNDWKTDFTISIAPESKKDFIKAGLDPQQWGGKKLRARGWLEFYNGPNVELDHPEAIEVLQ